MSDQSLVRIIEKIHTVKQSSVETLDPARDMSIDRSDLDSEFQRQAELAASYGYLFAEAEANCNKSEFDLAVLHAKLDKEVRFELADKGRVTEKMVENGVITNSEYQKAKHRVIDCKESKRLVKAACDSLDHKLQALINAGADHRKSFMEKRSLDTQDREFF